MKVRQMFKEEHVLRLASFLLLFLALFSLGLGDMTITGAPVFEDGGAVQAKEGNSYQKCWERVEIGDTFDILLDDETFALKEISYAAEEESRLACLKVRLLKEGEGVLPPNVEVYQIFHLDEGPYLEKIQTSDMSLRVRLPLDWAKWKNIPVSDALLFLAYNEEGSWVDVEAEYLENDAQYAYYTVSTKATEFITIAVQEGSQIVAQETAFEQEVVTQEPSSQVQLGTTGGDIETQTASFIAVIVGIVLVLATLFLFLVIILAEKKNFKRRRNAYAHKVNGSVNFSQLQAYVKKEKRKGKSDATLREELSSAGWYLSEINSVLKS